MDMQHTSAINQWVEGLPQGVSGVRSSVSANPRMPVSSARLIPSIVMVERR
jgi:hypothetical protein